MNILEDLWYGQIRPISDDSYRTADYQELVQLCQRNEARLLPTLNDKQKEDLQKIRDLVEEMQQITHCGAFITGFRLAVQLMAAAVDT